MILVRCTLGINNLVAKKPICTWNKVTSKLLHGKTAIELMSLTPEANTISHTSFWSVSNNINLY